MATMNNGQQIVISMTSFPAALGYAQKAIRSLLNGSVLPDKLVLYLTASQFVGVDIPKEMKEIQKSNFIFEIRYYDRNIRSYTKLIPALADFPDAVIVTVDDDVWYHKNMLRDLLSLHNKIPNAIIAHRARRIKKEKPYKKWPKYRWYNFLFKRISPHFSTLQTGVGGVLYPPYCLDEEMLDPDLFTSIAPTNDDIWFWAAATRRGTPVVPVPFGQNHPQELGKPRLLALRWMNYKAGEDRNAATLKRIIERYPDIEKKLK